MKAFTQENRVEKAKKGGKKSKFSQEQIAVIIGYVQTHNEARLKDIQKFAFDQYQITASLSTINNILKKNKITMKTLYRVSQVFLQKVFVM